MKEHEVWEKLEEIHRALEEALFAKYGRSRDPRVCVAAVKVNGRCESVDCPVCDALSTAKEVI